MNKRIILVYLFFPLALFIGACQGRAPAPAREAGAPRQTRPLPSQGSSSNHQPEAYAAPVRLATLEDRDISESSGIVASRVNPDLFWTHNDSGDGPFLYAFDRRGKSRGVWRVMGAKAQDWEDIAAGPGPDKGVSYLYVGNIGDNGRKRESVIVYRIAEPTIESAHASSSPAEPLQTEIAEPIRLEYPDGKHNAEALMVHPLTGDIYIITKTEDLSARIYKAEAPFNTTTTVPLGFIGEISVPSIPGGMITGADISPDGRRVVLCDYLGAYELILPPADSGFDNIWKQMPAVISLGERAQGEAVCYRLDGKAIMATSEKTPTPLIEVLRKE